MPIVSESTIKVPAGCSDPQIYIMVAETAAVLRGHISDEHELYSHLRASIMDGIDRIEEQLKENSAIHRDIDSRVKEIEQSFAWIKGGKTVFLGTVSILLTLGAVIGWVMTTFNIHFQVK